MNSTYKGGQLNCWKNMGGTCAAASAFDASLAVPSGLTNNAVRKARFATDSLINSLMNRSKKGIQHSISAKQMITLQVLAVICCRQDRVAVKAAWVSTSVDSMAADASLLFSKGVATIDVLSGTGLVIVRVLRTAFQTMP
jgi:hypothetical protein